MGKRHRRKRWIHQGWQKGKGVLAVILVLLLLFPATAGFAGSEDRVVTLGADLDPGQRMEMLDFFGAEESDVVVLEVTNEEEYLYLQGVAGRDVIGTRAISSVFLEVLPPGEGINVQTHNITWVTRDMYAAALVTAGVNDVRITAAAPFPVSGTAALTGVVKAFEEATGEKLEEDNKKVAHEELLILRDLAEEFNESELSTELIQRAKEEILENRPLDYEEIKDLLRRLSQEQGIDLTEEQISQLARFLEQFNHLEIDVEQVREQITKILEDPAARSLLARILEVITGLLQQVVELLRR